MSETTAESASPAAAPIPWLGYAFSALGAVLFSSKAIFIKLAYLEKSDAALMLALRMMMSLPFFLVIGLYALYLHRRAGRPYPGWRTVAFAAVNGFIGYYIAAYLDFAGLTFITAQLERLVLFTYPIFVMFLGWMFFKGRITPRGLLGAGITYAGLVLIFTNGVSLAGWNAAIGSLLVLAAALAFALYQLLAKDLIRVLGSTLFTAIAMSAAVSQASSITRSPRMAWARLSRGTISASSPAAPSSRPYCPPFSSMRASAAQARRLPR